MKKRKVTWANRIRTLKCYFVYWPERQRIIATYAKKKDARRCLGTPAEARRDGLVLVAMKGVYAMPKARP